MELSELFLWQPFRWQQFTASSVQEKRLMDTGRTGSIWRICLMTTINIPVVFFLRSLWLWWIWNVSLTLLGWLPAATLHCKLNRKYNNHQKLPLLNLYCCQLYRQKNKKTMFSSTLHKSSLISESFFDQSGECSSKAQR